MAKTKDVFGLGFERQLTLNESPAKADWTETAMPYSRVG
jgi:hypothetical protein